MAALPCMVAVVSGLSRPSRENRPAVEFPTQVVKYKCVKGNT